MANSQNFVLANQIKWELWNGEKFEYGEVSDHLVRLERSVSGVMVI
jgi:hypothetical protein